MSVDRISSEWAARDRNPVAAMTTLPEGFNMTVVPQPWILVDQQLPPAGLVLACTPDGGVIVIAGWSEKECEWVVPEWFGGANNGKRKKECFSHWMPLPEPPG
jgi:hypothetical protein